MRRGRGVLRLLRHLGRLVHGTVIGLALLVVLAPLLFAALGSLKSRVDVLTRPWALPIPPVWRNYATAFESRILLYMLNSLIVTTVSVLAIIVIGSLGAYALARLRFKGRTVVYMTLLSGLLIPVHAVLIPLYDITSRLHLLNTYFALIGPYIAFGLPLTILLLRTYFLAVPKQLEDAARMDGASDLTICFRIFVPLSKPAVATVAIFQAAWIWQEFPFALVLIDKASRKTLAVGLMSFQGEFAADWSTMLAGVVLAVAPVLFAYFMLQEHIVRGLTAGALRE
jgi:raffinose/stachyose/melibiose transport system permease protein